MGQEYVYAANKSTLLKHSNMVILHKSNQATSATLFVMEKSPNRQKLKLIKQVSLNHVNLNLLVSEFFKTQTCKNI